ncbi:acyl-CoA dehydrogenase family protein [Tumebacillus lipolyticus]|uniref:Acyl-CoA dehydrogenase family protein n=1 Tax=Tumebacillus lipolyticus TaxID=1280370 RepID=A0ABW4ZWD2_9BACL
MDLGQQVMLMVSEELGAVVWQDPLLDTLVAADVLSLYIEEQAPRLKAISEGELSIVTSGVVTNSEKTARLRVEDGPDGWTVDGDGGSVQHLRSAQEVLLSIPLEGGESLFLIPVDRVGMSSTVRVDVAKSPWYDLHFDGLHLRREDFVGRVDERMRSVTARARMRQAGFLIGIAGGALSEAVQYTAFRRQFDKRIIDNQAVGMRLASLSGRLEAVRLKAQQAAWLDDTGEDALRAATEALAMAAELALESERESLHFHGSFGMTKMALAHLYYTRGAVEAMRYGTVHSLWLEAGRLRVEEAKASSLPQTFAQPVHA